MLDAVVKTAFGASHSGLGEDFDRHGVLYSSFLRYDNQDRL